MGCRGSVVRGDEREIKVNSGEKDSKRKGNVAKDGEEKGGREMRREENLKK